MLSGTILKNLAGQVLQETLLAHTLNEIKILNILESNNSNNEIKDATNWKRHKYKKKKKSEMWNVSSRSSFPWLQKHDASNGCATTVMDEYDEYKRKR